MEVFKINNKLLFVLLGIIVRVDYLRSRYLKYIILILSCLFISSCATRENISFSVPRDITTDKIFICTTSSIHFFNSPESKPIRSIDRQYFIFNKFEENVTQEKISSGRLILGNYSEDPTLFSYQLKLIRKTSEVTLYGKTVGPYYNKELNLKPSLNILSNLILECINQS